MFSQSSTEGMTVTETIWTGLVQGAIYALVASGFTLSLLPSGVFNFAQGALVVGGTYLTYLWLHNLGLPLILAVAANIVIGLAVGAVTELLTVRPLRRGPGGASAGPSHSELVTTVGLSTALVGIFGIIWGYNPLQVPWRGSSHVVVVAGIRMLPLEITLLAGAIIVAVGLYLVVRFTMLGHACLAVSQDREAAMLRGVNVSLLSIAAFACAGGLAGLSAIAIGPVTYALPTLANSLALGGFVALAIGGEGSFLGALAGGLLVGIVSALAVRYIDADYANLSVLVLLLLTLGLRPKGIGRRAEARVV
jgi:branched-chain amino acid transport system permease protein